MSLLAELDRRDAEARLAAARDALRRADACAPAFDSIPNSDCVHSHLGAMKAHVGLLAQSLETLLGAGA